MKLTPRFILLCITILIIVLAGTTLVLNGLSGGGPIISSGYGEQPRTFNFQFESGAKDSILASACFLYQGGHLKCYTGPNQQANYFGVKSLY